MKKYIGIAISVIIVIYIGIFYYNNFYVPDGEEFDIKYTNLRVMESVGDPTEEKHELTDHGLYTRTNFIKNGDKVEYMFDVINDGTLDAILKYDPIQLSTDYYFKKHITYKMIYTDGTPVRKDDELNSGETKTIIVTIEYSVADFASRDSQFYESNSYLWFVRKG